VQRLGLTIFATRLGQQRNLSVSGLYGPTWPAGMIGKAGLRIERKRNGAVQDAVFDQLEIRKDVILRETFNAPSFLNTFP
jgi:hypothetical protein